MGAAGWGGEGRQGMEISIGDSATMSLRQTKSQRAQRTLLGMRLQARQTNQTTAIPMAPCQEARQTASRVRAPISFADSTQDPFIATSPAFAIRASKRVAAVR